MTALGDRAQLALDTIYQKPVKGIPIWMYHDLEWSHLERVAGAEPGEYEKHPDEVYMRCQRVAHTCMIDQYIPRNPLTMRSKGYTHGGGTPTTGMTNIIVDGIPIDSPEAVVEHIETIAIPSFRKEIAEFDESTRVREIIEGERNIQDNVFGPDILKVPYAVASFPALGYYRYGYENYLMAFALYPDVCERHFSAAADYGILRNRAVARAYLEGHLPPVLRLDFDMADSRGTIVDIKELDRIWFPHFARSLEPLLKSPVKLIWHCDGNLMQMVPRLLEVGLKGFQGFQYEDGMDYMKICKMRTRDGEPLLIWAGLSVTRTLPHGTPDDIRKEARWLVEHAPKTGFFLASSSSITPGVPWENIQAYLEARAYYLAHGRG